MKTEGPTSNVIWTTNVDLPHLGSDECLPVIGSCQVSSILSNLDEPDKIQNVDIPEMEVILLHNDEYKTPLVNEQIMNQNYIILKDKAANILNLTKGAESPKKFKKTKSKKDEILFVSCHLCPFLCLSETRMSEHAEKVHKNGESVKHIQMSCPACPNVFYHKISLQNHLSYDHNVSETDLNVIMQFFTNNLESKLSEMEAPKEDVTNYILNTEKIIQDENNDTNCSDLNIQNNLEGDSTLQVIKNLEPLDSENSIVNLPTIDLSQNHAEKLFNDYIKRPDAISKFLEAKTYHKCPMCKARMQDLEKLKYHVKCHSETYFKCPECSTPFSFWKPLIGHLWRTHKINMELYSCDKCDYKSFSLAKLNNVHKLIHNEAKGFVCEQCNKAFKNVKQLRNHKWTHKKKTNNATYNCEICIKKFFDKRQLRVHMDSVHKKLKPFLCNFCGYKGSTKSSLKMHIRQHTGEKPFLCDTCDYVTSDHNSLRRHKLRHSGQKPYKCSHCDYACIQSSTYKVHLKRKHPGLEKDLLFSCQDCQFKTINKEIFCTHVTTVHKHKIIGI